MKKPKIETLKEELKKLTELVLKADASAQQYTENPDTASLEFLESCKIDLNNVMLELSSYYARFRAGNDYYDQYRKQVKAERLEHLIEDQKMNVTKAKELVYAEPVYKEFLEEFNYVKRIYFLVSRKYSLYEATMQNIKQTISAIRKEQQYENELKSINDRLDVFAKIMYKVKKLLNIE